MTLKEELDLFICEGNIGGSKYSIMFGGKGGLLEFALNVDLDGIKEIMEQVRVRAYPSKVVIIRNNITGHTAKMYYQEWERLMYVVKGKEKEYLENLAKALRASRD